MLQKEHSIDFYMECDCGCSILKLEVDKDEETGYMSLYEMSFMTHQQPFLYNLKENLRLIWSVIRGRRFRLYDIVIPKEKMEEFKKFVADI